MTLRPWGKQGPSSSSRVSIIMCVVTQKYGLSSGVYDLWWKSIYFFPLYGLDNLIQVSWIHGFDLLPCSLQRGLFENMPTSGIFSTHSVKLTICLFHSLWSHLWFDWWLVCREWPAPEIQSQLDVEWTGLFDLHCSPVPLLPEPIW